MPPKQKPKKEEDLPDVSTLPKVNPIFAKYILNFNNMEVFTAVKEQLYNPASKKFKIITREQIIECGKRKDFILEENEDDFTDTKKLAKSAACLFYEQLVASMKEKEQRFKEIKSKAIAEYLEKNQPKTEEKKEGKAAKASAAKSKAKKEEELNIDIPIDYPVNETDVIFILPDYPISIEEHLALNEESYAINMLISLSQTFTPPSLNIEEKKEDLEGRDEENLNIEEKKDNVPDEPQESNEKVELSEEEKEKLEEDRKFLEDLKISNLKERQNYIDACGKCKIHSELNSNFYIEYQYFHNIQDLAQSTLFLEETLLNKISEIGNLLVQYNLFLSNVKLAQLFPATNRQLEEVERLKKEKMDEEAKIQEAIAKAKEEKKGAVKEELPPKPKYDTNSVKRFKQIPIQLSGDDDLIKFPFKTYRNLMNSLEPEVKKESFLLYTILNELYTNDHSQVNQEIQKPKTLEALFESIKANQESQHPPIESNIQEMQVSIKSEAGPSMKIFMEDNPIEVRYDTEHYPNSSIPEFEISLQSNLKLIGLNRENMPKIPEMSFDQRVAKKTEMYPFSKLDLYLFNHSLILNKFVEIFKNEMPKQDFSFGSRCNILSYDKLMLVQKLAGILLLEPEIISSYSSYDDSLLVGIYFKNANGNCFRKQWATSYNSVPFFRNWINYYPKDNPSIEPLLDFDDRCVGNISEKVKFIYPSDNSIIKISKQNIQNDLKTIVMVMKDNLLFGIKEKTINSSNFWIKFPTETRMEAELEQVTLNDGQKEKGIIMSFTLNCGLIVQLNSQGDVIQTKDFSNHIMNPPNKTYETYRVITSKGTVLKYYSDNVIEALFANGNVSIYKEGFWESTNNKGMRRKRNVANNIITEEASIPSTHISDPTTNTKTMIRNDEVISIKFEDGLLYTMHKDGTLITTVPQDNAIFVESSGFAPVKIIFRNQEEKPIIKAGNLDAILGEDNLMKRSFDGRLMQTFLPDNSIISSYKEVQETANPEKNDSNYIHLIQIEDGTIIKAKQDGEIVIISSNQREILNQQGKKLRPGHDSDYFSQLFSEISSRKIGVYTCNLPSGSLQMQDPNQYGVYANGDLLNPIDMMIERPATPVFNTLEYSDESIVPSKYTLDPVLLVINNDNTGYEILNDRQLEYYRRIKGSDLETKVFKRDHLLGFEKSESIIYISRNLKDKEKLDILRLRDECSIPKAIKKIKKIVIPRLPILPNIFTYRSIIKHPSVDGVLHDKFKESVNEFIAWKDNQKILNKEFGLGNNDHRTKEEKKKDKEILIQILKYRRSRDVPITEEEIRRKALEEFEKTFSRQQFEIEQNNQMLGKKDEDKFFSISKTIEKSQDTSIQHHISPEEKEPQLNEMEKSLNSKSDDAISKSKSLQTTQTISFEMQSNLFVPNYYMTKVGSDFAQQNPPKPPSIEFIMKQEGLRKSQHSSIEGGEKKEEVIKVESKKEQQILQEELNENQLNNEQENPVVSLVPEQKTKKISNSIMSSIKEQETSNYKKLMDQIKNDHQKKTMQAHEYHVLKTKDFTLTGEPRTVKPFVKSIKRPILNSDINEKHIGIESITDRRIKISSMVNRLMMKAPNISEIQRMGQHQMVLQAIEKKMTFNEMMANNTAMISYALHDKLKKNFLIIPDGARFGKIKAGEYYEVVLQCKNEDVMGQRITIRGGKEKCIKVVNKTPGLIASGMSTYLSVYLKTIDSFQGLIQDEFSIVTKGEIFKVQVSASALSPNEYDIQDKDSLRTLNKPLQLPHVRCIKEIKGSNDNKILEEAKNNEEGEEEDEEVVEKQEEFKKDIPKDSKSNSPIPNEEDPSNAKNE